MKCDTQTHIFLTSYLYMFKLHLVSNWLHILLCLNNGWIVLQFYSKSVILHDTYSYLSALVLLCCKSCTLNWKDIIFQYVYLHFLKAAFVWIGFLQERCDIWPHMFLCLINMCELNFCWKFTLGDVIFDDTVSLCCMRYFERCKNWRHWLSWRSLILSHRCSM